MPCPSSSAGSPAPRSDHAHHQDVSAFSQCAQAGGDHQHRALPLKIARSACLHKPSLWLSGHWLASIEISSSGAMRRIARGQADGRWRWPATQPCRPPLPHQRVEPCGSSAMKPPLGPRRRGPAHLPACQPQPKAMFSASRPLNRNPMGGFPFGAFPKKKPPPARSAQLGRCSVASHARGFRSARRGGVEPMGRYQRSSSCPAPLVPTSCPACGPLGAR